MALVAGSISDGRVLSLIESFLHQDIMTEAARWQPTTGTPQGAVLSPLLANLYLHPLDLLMEQDGYRMVRYADDFVILCASAAEAEAALRQVSAWVAANGLTLHPDKTRIGDCLQPGQGFDFLGYRFEAGHRFVRQKSLDGFKDKVRAKTGRSRGDSLGCIIADLNPLLRRRFGYLPYPYRRGDACGSMVRAVCVTPCLGQAIDHIASARHGTTTRIATRDCVRRFGVYRTSTACQSSVQPL